MKSIGYHAFNDTQGNLFCCSKKSEQYPLVVNCSGIIHLNKPFQTQNSIGRVDYYLLYVTLGSLTVNFPDETKKIHRGDFLIIPPYTPYSYSGCESDELQYYYVHFSGSSVPEILSEYGLSLYPSLAGTVQFEKSLAASFSSFFDTFAKTDKLRDRELYLRFDRILMTLSRRNGAAIGQDSDKLVRSTSYINSHFTEKIMIAELADMESMSISSYNSLFVSSFGIPPGEYIIKLRLTLAVSLLSDTDLSVKEIGAICGYPDQHFFSKIFKSHISMSPKKYRESHRGISN